MDNSTMVKIERRIGGGGKVLETGYQQSYTDWVNRGTGWLPLDDVHKKIIKRCLTKDGHPNYAYLFWLLHAHDVKWVDHRMH